MTLIFFSLLSIVLVTQANRLVSAMDRSWEIFTTGCKIFLSIMSFGLHGSAPLEAVSDLATVQGWAAFRLQHIMSDEMQWSFMLMACMTIMQLGALDGTALLVVQVSLWFALISLVLLIALFVLALKSVSAAISRFAFSYLSPVFGDRLIERALDVVLPPPQILL